MTTLTEPHAPPREIPVSGDTEIHDQQKNNAGIATMSEDQNEDVDMIPTRANQQVVQVTNSQPTQPKKNSHSGKDSEVTRSDPQETRSKNGHPVEENRDSGAEEDDDPQNPLKKFDWDGFEARYQQAMSEANKEEQVLRDDFEQLVQYFGVWASAAAQYDNDRSLKRIKTRRLYVQHAEQSLEQKISHHTQVVEAFKNALALLENS